MSAQDFVREARTSDAAGLARVQVDCWRQGYAGIVPDEVLAEVTSEEAEAQWRERWAEAISKPPSSRHRVLVAVSRPDPARAAGPEEGQAAAPGQGQAAAPGQGQAASSGQDRPVAGFASVGPATDSDRWPATDAELYELRVAPALTRRGHGSRLLNAAADTLAEDRFTGVSCWVLEADTALRRFLESAGWAGDGAEGHLDMGVRVPIVRLHVSLGDPLDRAAAP